MSRRTRMLSPAFAAGLLAVFAAGCASAKAARDPEKYQEVLDAVVGPTADVAPGEKLTLERAMKMAVRHDERLGLRGEDYVQALVEKDRALGAFLPTLSFRPSFVVADAPAGTGSTSGGGLGAIYIHRGDTLQSLDAPVVGHMNLFREFGDVADVKAAEAVVAQRRELLLDLQQTVMIDAAQAYYVVLRAERSVEVLAELLKTQEARLVDVENQLKNGLATRLTASQTRAQVDAVRSQFLRAQTDVANARTTLAFVLGVKTVGNPLEDAYVVPDQVESADAFEKTALERRRDLVAARDATAAARRRIDAAMAQYYPSVSLDVAAFLHREMFWDASKWNALLSLNLPIFSANQIESDVREAWSALRQAALEESLLAREIHRDVRAAHENLESTVRLIAQIEDQVRAVEEALAQAESAVRNGLGVNLDVLIALEALQRAQLDLSGAKFDRAVFHLDLMRATGRLLVEPPAPAAPR